MLDTRNIQIFANPDRFLEVINPLLFERKFSPWGKDSVNLVISELLINHIYSVLGDKNNFKKLLLTSEKVGFKVGQQLLFMGSTQPVLIMTEVISNKVIRISTGVIQPNGVYAFIVAGDVELFPDGIDGGWYQSESPIISDRYKSYDSDMMDKLCRSYLERAVSMYIYLTLIEVEIVHVLPKEKFVAKKYEGFKNQQKVKLNVADLSWSRTTVQSLPIAVTGHLRNQPYGPGRTSHKLIYIEPFLKSGYIKKSGKERILKTT